MSYWTQNVMSTDYYLTNRIAACAAREGAGSEADQWTHDNRRIWAGADAWVEAWERYLLNHPEPQSESPDHESWIPPGLAKDCITDGMIQSQVQHMLGNQ